MTVIDRGPEHRLVGSTGHAPGYVSLLSEAPVLSALAIASADLYEGLEPGRAGFDRIGGLEIATSEAALGNLHRRVGLAADVGIEALPLDPVEAVAQAPLFVDRESCHGGVLYRGDGAANGEVVTSALKARAARAGASFHYDTTVTAIDTHADHVTAVRSATGDRFEADDVVVAAGIWGAEVAALAGEQISFTPVEHPYVFGPARASSAYARLPFVKWREETVYARDHGDRLGIGTHDHPGLAVDTSVLTEAELAWSDDSFEAALERAFQLFPPEHRFTVDRRLNGVFAMTADNLPLVGAATRVEGLWIGEALWITHAGGGAGVLVDMITGRTPAVEGLEAVRPGRFDGQDADELTARALKKYREIWMPMSSPSVPT